MTSRKTITVNRAPVLTLWGTVVAERLGHDLETALTLGKALAGLNAQAKGRRLGIFQPAPHEVGKPPRRIGLGKEMWIDLCGRPIPAKRTPNGIRAVVLDQPIDPAKVHDYLARAFGEDLTAVKEALGTLARSYAPEDLAASAFFLYERFRPTVASGKSGWGQKGELSIERILSLARGE